LFFFRVLFIPIPLFFLFLPLFWLLCSFLTSFAYSLTYASPTHTLPSTQSGAGQWPRQALVAPLVALAGAAFSLQHLGQARTLYEQALQVTEKEAGATSPDTAAALNDLAIVVRASVVGVYYLVLWRCCKMLSCEWLK
jgi:hypothetical protein